MAVKAVVLARGKGSRMREPDNETTLAAAQEGMADAGVKAMIPFRRPFLDYVLCALADAGCTDVCLVVAPDDGVIREHYAGTHRPRRVSLTFAVQEQPLGTANAVLAAEAFVGQDPFLVMNADNYYPAEVLRTLAGLGGPGLPAFPTSSLIRESNFDGDRIRSYAILKIAESGDLEDIIEKPEPSDVRAFGSDPCVSMNCWRFDATIFEACAAIEPSPRGEFELPHAVRYAVRTLGRRFRTFVSHAGVLDLSRRSDIPAVALRLDALDPRP